MTDQPAVHGLTVDLFRRVEEELLKSPAGASRERAIRCLTEIHDRFKRVDTAASDAQTSLSQIWLATEAARHQLRHSQVPFGVGDLRRSPEVLSP